MGTYVEWSPENAAYIVEGESLDDIELSAWRDGWIDQWERELIDLAKEKLGEDDEEGGSITGVLAAGFIGAFSVAVASRMVGAYLSGRGGLDKMTRGDYAALSDALQKQDGFVEGFGKDLAAGVVTRAQAFARAGMYAGGAVGAFEEGKVSQRGFRAPALPGSDCRGLTRCRCYWEITEYADRYEGTWKAKGDANTCDVCADHAAKWAPLVQEK